MIVDPEAGVKHTLRKYWLKVGRFGQLLDDDNAVSQLTLKKMKGWQEAYYLIFN
jgi:hypothetical protein